MKLELIRDTVTNMLGGAVNLDAVQLTGLINQAIQQISALLTPDRAPRLVVRAHLDDPTEELASGIGGMEGDLEDLTGWSEHGDAPNDNAKRDTADKRNGASSCRLQTTSSWIRTTNSLEPVGNRKYTYSYWAKRTGDMSDYYNIKVSFDTYDADGVQLDEKFSPTYSGELSDSVFTKFRGEVTFNSNVHTFKMRFGLKEYAGASVPNPNNDYANVDDVSLLSSMYNLPEDSHGNISNLYVDGVSAELVPPNRVQEITGESNQFVVPGSVSPVYAIEGDKIVFGPSSATRVEALYLKKPKELTEGTDECDLPNDVQALIFPLVAYYGALSNGSYEDAQLHQAGYVSGLQSLGLVIPRGPENA